MTHPAQATPRAQQKIVQPGGAGLAGQNLVARLKEHAQSICAPYCLKNLPAVAQHLRGLRVSTTSYHLPEERSISEPIGFGRRISEDDTANLLAGARITNGAPGFAHIGSDTNRQDS